MFGIGFPELLVILAIALIVLGPEQLPQVARKIAGFVNELRRAADEFKSEFDVDEVTDLKLLDKMDLSKLDQASRPPGGVGGEWRPATGEGKKKEVVETTQADAASKGVEEQGPREEGVEHRDTEEPRIS